jgi:hypothetical protein
MQGLVAFAYLPFISLYSVAGVATINLEVATTYVSTKIEPAMLRSRSAELFARTFSNVLCHSFAAAPWVKQMAGAAIAFPVCPKKSPYNSDGRAV